ncbi:MAG TPA: phosphodiester glycosidase family protein [Solirubrobacterales bacterium]|nr:phosphodiester glycosidase family protein [Solirubrobacterales bacterium]
MLRPAIQPLAAPRELFASRIRLPDDAATTLHVARFDRATVRARVVRLPPRLPLRSWCTAAGVDDAIVGGFFVRPEGTPLGDLRIGGMTMRTVPFDSPWDERRSCVHIDGGRIALASRDELEAMPAGDLLQAGPMLVRDAANCAAAGHDPEGFSAGSRQFDSDITVGRYPRAALALTPSDVLAVVCDGRTDADAGLTLSELAAALVDLGAEQAINLDGGGSASLVFDGRLRNRPHEEHGVPLPVGRPIATAITFSSR